MNLERKTKKLADNFTQTLVEEKKNKDIESVLVQYQFNDLKKFKKIETLKWEIMKY